MRRAVVAALVLGPIAIVMACGGDHYVYTARRYDADGACLDPYKSIDFVNGDSVSSKCAPNCFQFGGETFTSVVCPPLPDLATALDAEAPECKAAIALYDTTCGGDAGSAYDAGDDDDDARHDVLDAGDGGDQ